MERDCRTQIGHYGKSGTQGVSYENRVFSRALATPGLSLLLSASVSLCRSLCGQAEYASMLVIRTNRDEGGRMGYTPRTREGRMKEQKKKKTQKNKRKSNIRHEENTGELLLLALTCFHRELYHFNSIKGTPQRNTHIRWIVSS